MCAPTLYRLRRITELADIDPTDPNNSRLLAASLTIQRALPLLGSATVEAIRAATASGTTVVVITHCDSGTVDLDRHQPGRAMCAAGAISGTDMIKEAALAKTRLPGRHRLPGGEPRRWMTTNLLG
ncbi:hypothetical protein AB0L63_20030 [Nocardia sp. NPDC051990]|uniref:hypothetical protein n=1 Tax=Nocardia sp. NPDC051990 TaxID=3155285 RepID=UPI003429681E